MTEHLSEQQVLDFYTSRCKPEWRIHVAACGRCRELVQGEAATEHLLHHLKPRQAPFGLSEKVLKQLSQTRAAANSKPVWAVAALALLSAVVALSPVSGPPPYPIDQISKALFVFSETWLAAFNQITVLVKSISSGLDPGRNHTLWLFLLPGIVFLFYAAADHFLHHLPRR